MAFEASNGGASNCFRNGPFISGMIVRQSNDSLYTVSSQDLRAPSAVGERPNLLPCERNGWGEKRTLKFDTAEHVPALIAGRLWAL